MSAILPEYATTSDGHLAARLGDFSYIAVPTDTQLRIASAWRFAKPIEDLSIMDVHGCEQVADDEAGFRAWLVSVAHHLSQREALGRKEVRMALSTPWGASQGATIYADGVIAHSTASHGGFKLDRKRNAALHPALRNAGGWYEEDCEWAKVAMGFPDLFTDRERECADRTLKDWSPEVWEAFTGKVLSSEDSFMRERQHFERVHAADWIVIAASRSDKHPGQVEVVATHGGRRDSSERRSFLVPCGEYAAGQHGFVIDLARHALMPAG